VVSLDGVAVLVADDVGVGVFDGTGVTANSGGTVGCGVLVTVAATDGAAEGVTDTVGV
jgi:hypothetical protein